MQEYARVCQSMPEYARVCQSMPEYARECQSMPEYAIRGQFYGKPLTALLKPDTKELPDPQTGATCQNLIFKSCVSHNTQESSQILTVSCILKDLRVLTTSQNQCPRVELVNGKGIHKYTGPLKTQYPRIMSDADTVLHMKGLP